MATLIAVLGMAGLCAAAPPRLPPLPYEDAGACPFECCTYRNWSVRAATDILAERRDGARTRFRVQPGDVVVGVTGVVVTTRIGRAEAVEAASLAGRPVPTGTVVPLLSYVGEGVWRFWFEGVVGEELIPGADECRDPARRAERGCAIQLRERPKITWWVKIRNRAGQEGWSRQVDHFGNIDACG